jgi:DNA-binding NarL/FixJ family response regulator
MRRTSTPETMRRMCPSVLIVDDHAEFRRAARALLDAEGYEVVGEAVDGASALREARRLRPALVVLDIHLPDADGFDIAAQLAAEPDPPGVVLTSSRAVTAYRRRLATTPALGFIPKSQLSRDALSAFGA